ATFRAATAPRTHRARPPSAATARCWQTSSAARGETPSASRKRNAPRCVVAPLVRIVPRFTFAPPIGCRPASGSVGGWLPRPLPAVHCPQATDEQRQAVG